MDYISTKMPDPRMSLAQFGLDQAPPGLEDSMRAEASASKAVSYKGVQLHPALTEGVKRCGSNGKVQTGEQRKGRDKQAGARYLNTRSPCSSSSELSVGYESVNLNAPSFVSYEAVRGAVEDDEAVKSVRTDGAAEGHSCWPAMLKYSGSSTSGAEMHGEVAHQDVQHDETIRSGAHPKSAAAHAFRLPHWARLRKGSSEHGVGSGRVEQTEQAEHCDVIDMTLPVPHQTKPAHFHPSLVHP